MAAVTAAAQSRGVEFVGEGDVGGEYPRLVGGSLGYGDRGFLLQHIAERIDPR